MRAWLSREIVGGYRRRTVTSIIIIIVVVLAAKPIGFLRTQSLPFPPCQTVKGGQHHRDDTESGWYYVLYNGEDFFIQLEIIAT